MSETALAGLAGRQAGAFSAEQAEVCGYDKHRRTREVRRGRWRRPYVGVYTVAGSPDTPEQRLWAAWLALAPDAAVSHVSGLWLWDCGPAAPERRDLTVPLGRSRTRRGIEIHQASDFFRLRIPRRRGLRVTTPMRCLVDAAPILGPEGILEAYDRAVGRKLVTPAAMLGEVNRLTPTRRGGAGILRAILHDAGVGAERSPSYLEAKSRRRFKRAGLPEPVVELEWLANGRFRLDFTWTDLGLVVEVDGWECHSSSAAKSRDERRRNKIVLTDVFVLNYTYDRILYEGTAVTAEVEAAMVLRQSRRGSA